MTCASLLSLRHSKEDSGQLQAWSRSCPMACVSPPLAPPMGSGGCRLHCRNLRETGPSLLVFAMRQIRLSVFIVCLMSVTLQRGLCSLPLGLLKVSASSPHPHPRVLGGEPAPTFMVRWLWQSVSEHGTLEFMVNWSPDS